MAVDRAERVSPEAETARLLFQLLHRLKQHFFDAASSVELSPPQAHALRLLVEPQPMGELAAQLHCDASNVTGIVDRLQARGLVERQSDASDRRVKQLSLTAAGQQVREQLEAHILQADFFPNLTPPEREQLRRLLERALSG